jgi:3-oxoacyl-(acyl-carrier-protein) synthase
MHHDRKGRSLVAVTGMGFVTSLGLGKADNWTALSAGRSGIRPITRFPKASARPSRRRRFSGHRDLFGAGTFDSHGP